MWKLNFYVLPIKGSLNIMENVYNFGEKVEYLNENENLYIPDEFYEESCIDGKSIMDFLNSGSQSDAIDYLLELVTKLKRPRVKYEEIPTTSEYGYLSIDESQRGVLYISDVHVREHDTYIEVSDVVALKRIYLEKVDSYDDYITKATSCFPDIVFHDDVFDSLKNLGHLRDVISELTRHLNVLNDCGAKLYSYYAGNESKVFKALKSKYNIECSGKGSKESKRYDKTMLYDGVRYNLTCNPHTKLFSKSTNQRIYFCWGREEIENHKLIVVHIGAHWS